ncbi:MAG: hypothetical protein ACXWUD_13140 [Methylosarcina sp.]
MDVNLELENLIKEVQRKLGRNVLLFQQIEHMLKYMLAYQDVSFWKSNDGLKSNLEERKNRVSKLCLGQIAKEYIGNTFSFADEVSKEQSEQRDDAFFMGIKNDPIICDIDFYNQRKDELTALIAERNDLIHHFLPKWNFKQYESVSAAEKYLDQQRERTLPEYEFLTSLIQNFHDSRKQIAEYIRSDEYHKFLELSFLRDSQHVAGLYEFATTRKRDDGWAVLGGAGLYIREKISEDFLADELANIKKKYGCKTLKEIALKSEYFDIRDEPTEKGGVRIIYQIKLDLEFYD